MAYSESLARRIRQVFGHRRGSTEKKMFGGVGFLLNGNMCVGIWKTSLIVRLGPEQGWALTICYNVLIGIDSEATGKAVWIGAAKQLGSAMR
jgi:hypothetical protein